MKISIIKTLEEQREEGIFEIFTLEKNTLKSLNWIYLVFGSHECLKMGASTRYLCVGVGVKMMEPKTMTNTPD